MRRIHGFYLVALVNGLLAYWAFSPAFSAYSSGETAPPPTTKSAPSPSTLQQATPEQCQAQRFSLPEENAGKYSNGSLVTNINLAEKNHAYECTVAGWCNQNAYAPGSKHNGVEIWPNAWKDLGECAAQPQVNTLNLSFSTVTGKVPFKTTVKGVGPQPQANFQVSGVLRCKAEEIPFAGPADQPLTLKDLKPCRYDVIMNAAQGYLPLTTPMQVEFKAGAPETISREIKFRLPLDLQKLVALPGVSIELFASGLFQPRQMAMGDKVLYVGSSAIPVYTYDESTAGFIYALPLDNEGKPTGIYVVASGLEEPHGVAYRNGNLYFSTSGKLYRVRNIDQTYRDAHPEVVLNFPADEPKFPLLRPGQRIWHQKHPLYFAPGTTTEDAIYTAVGIPCNSCMIPADERYGTLLRYDLNTGNSLVLAKGIRNAVGFAWGADGKLWFSDNNRQNYLNTDEIDHITVPGQHFGVPYFYGRDTPGFTQEEYQEPGSIQPPLAEGAIVSDKPLHQLKPQDYRAPAYELGSNTAPLGIAFLKGFDNGADAGGLQRLLVAVHGTGTKASPGMELRMLTVEGNEKVVGQIPLVTGWGGSTENFNVYCLDDSCLGRPTDMLQLSDNSLLVSDDLAGVIYRIRYDRQQIGDTSLSLKPTAAPNAELAPLMVTGTLVDEQGRSRRFDVAWGDTPLNIQGLEPGKYTLELNNVGDHVPTVRHQKLVLSAEHRNPEVSLAYQERPPFVPVEVTLVAPGKPADSDAPDQWEVTLLSGSETQVVKVPWGGRQEVSLSRGEHKFNFPYYRNALPEPTQQVVSVEDDSQDPVTVQAQYRHEPELGKQVVATACAICHTVQYFQDANKAINWSLAGKEALVQQIRGMAVRGHCDVSCGEQIADYFYNELWAGYLDPGQAFGKRQLRLLTRDEYAQSVRDLFGVTINPQALPSDKFEKDFKYPGEADLGVLQAEDLKAYYDMALKIAGEASLAGRSVESLGRQVFRRPLSSAEVQRYGQVKAGEGGDQALVAALLLSPHFLYRSELGTDSGKATGEHPLTQYERATALSYSLLGTTPSDALLQQAEQGQLQTPEQIAAVAEQMLTSEQGKKQFNHFISYYLRTSRGVSEKPGLVPTVIQSMVEEQARLVSQVITDGGSFNELFNPGYTFLDQGLALHYGIGGVGGGGMQRVAVDDKRGGLLHLGLTQAVNSDFQVTSLVKRGIMIREQLLCREFGAPVDADPVEPQYPPKAISTRERWDLVNGEHASEGRCWQCHKYMNDTGSSMEHYDAAGRYRVEEPAYNNAQFPGTKLPINAAGPFLSNTGSENWGNVRDVRDIARLLPGNTTAQTCMADSYFRFMFGNKVSAGSVGTLKAAAESLKADGSLIKMIRELASSPVFLNRQEEN